MNRKGKRKLPDSRSRAQKLSRAAGGPNLRGDRPDCHLAKVGLSPGPLNRYAVPAIYTLLLLAVILVFGQTARYEFVNLDDNNYVHQNPQVVHGFTAPGIAWAFTHYHAANWHPLTWLSHMLDCQLYGLDHPGGHHATSVLLHAASAILLFRVLRQMTGDLWPSAFAAALFAIHPLHVESVAWVAERKDVLSGLFFMLTLAAYAGYARRPFSLLRYLLVTALLVLGLMAKPMLTTLPFVFLLLDYWPLGRLFSSAATPGGKMGAGRQVPRVLLEKLPWLALVVASCVVTYLAQGAALAPFQYLPFPVRLSNALVSCVAYVGQFFYPAGLAVFYPYSQNTLPIWKIVAAGLLVAGIFLAIVACRGKCPYLPVGWLWYLGMLVPVIGLVQVGCQAMADRYTYLPQIGLYIALAWGAEQVFRHRPYGRALCGATSAIVVAALAWCAWQQVSYWKDDEALFSHALACTSENWFVHNNLGATLASRGQFDEAIAHYRRALEFKPDYDLAHSNLGDALTKQGQFDEGIAHFQKALKINSNNADGHDNFGIALARRGWIDEAIVHFRKALEIMPDFAKAHYNLGIALARRGKVDEAITHFQEAVEIQPDFVEVHCNLGNALAARGKLDEAITHYQKAVEIKPDFAEAHCNLGNALAARGKLDEAIQHYRIFLRLNPREVLSHVQLGNALARQGKRHEAEACLREALDLATRQNEPALAESIQARIRLYESGTPVHESPLLPAKTSSRP